MRDVEMYVITLRTSLQEGISVRFWEKKNTTEMVRIYKNLHDRNGRQAVGELRRIDLFNIPNWIFCLWELCNIVLLNANSKFQFEFGQASCQVLVYIAPNKTK